MLSVVPTPVTVRVPSKVNLHLAVGDLRPDGYHDLHTVFQALSLYDEVSVVPADTLSVTVRGAGAESVPTDSTNLAWRAAEMMAERAARTPDVAITIDKGIPVAGGMAGGSADAAATLVALDALWGIGAPREDLADLAARLGSDVPFCLHGGTAIGTGRGERLVPVLTRGTFHWVLAAADIGLSTPDVYRHFDTIVEREERSVPAPAASMELMTALRSGDAQRLAAHLRNDLQEAAVELRPELGDVISSGLHFGALAGIVSGSGPTVAFLVADSESAIDLAVALAATRTVSETFRATGPVHGASVRGVARVD